LGFRWIRGGENKQIEQIAALEKAVEGLESRLRLIKVEWEEVLDKVGKVMGRLNARIRKSEAVNASESDAEPEREAIPPHNISGSHSTLTAMRGRRRGVLPG